MRLTLGELISKYRADNKMSLRAFADKCGGKITASYISMLERNRNPKNGKPIIPSLTTYKVVADALGYDLEDVLWLIDEEDMLEDVERAVKEEEEDTLERATDDFREQLRRRPGMRTLFDAAKDASDEDLLRAVAIIEALKGK